MSFNKQDKAFLSSKDIILPYTPEDQLKVAATAVVASWEAKRAKNYRATMKQSDEWGMGIVIQQMAFGNLGSNSYAAIAHSSNTDPKYYSVMGGY